MSPVEGSYVPTSVVPLVAAVSAMTSPVSKVTLIDEPASTVSLVVAVMLISCFGSPYPPSAVVDVNDVMVGLAVSL